MPSVPESFGGLGCQGLFGVFRFRVFGGFRAFGVFRAFSGLLGFWGF